jgi:hypothetical protein
MDESSFNDPDSLRVGPVWIGGAIWAERAPADDIRENGGQKLPVVVRFRHRATITIRPSARSYARLRYGPGPRGFRNTPVRIRLIACQRVRHGGDPPDPGVIRSTFFPGAIALKYAPACVPITIRVDRREPVRRTIGLGMHCPER